MIYKSIMKAKRIIRVELKNPVLRGIRKVFRDIIELSVKQEVDRLYAISRQYRKESRESTDSAEKVRLEREDDKFMDRGSRLRKLLSKSIIQCNLGGGCSSLSEATQHGFYPNNRPTNLDMAWMPSFKAWYCTKCCEILIEGGKLLKEGKHPDYIRQLKYLGLM